MLTIFSALQYAHRPAYVIKGGRRSRSFDVPERMDSILSAIREQGLGPIVPPADAENVLTRMQHHKYGVGATIIGEVVAEHPGQVVMKTSLGASRIVDMPVGELLPRIC